MNNTLTITAQYSSNMIPCIIFGEYGWNFIFVNTSKNECIKSEDVTLDWLAKNNIAIDEYVNHCWNEYHSMKDVGVTHGIISYFTKDDEIIYNYSNQIDVADSYEKIFNF